MRTERQSGSDWTARNVVKYSSAYGWGPSTLKTNMYQSNIKRELRVKYLLKKVSPIALIGLVCFAAYFWMMINALAVSASPLIIYQVY